MIDILVPAMPLTAPYDTGLDTKKNCFSERKKRQTKTSVVTK